ncbi:MAG TPA: aldolase/citrate lyase family protein, partial [Actinomycetota bacterium]|nr:aldolase/citrate lyase family protein [Actinomycetota bacterium]
MVVDLEHSELGLHHLPDLLRAAAATPAHALVRTSHLAAAEIARTLDAGAEGVIVPNVASAGEAAALVAAAHYPPAGRRG